MSWRAYTAPMAGVVGPLVLATTVVRNWHGWAPAPFWLDDVIAGAGLIATAILARDGQDSLKGRLLSGALAFTVAVLWGSLFEAKAGLHPPPELWSAAPHAATTMTIIALGLAMLGLGFSLPSKRPPVLGTRPEKQKARR
ncbi:MAG: hypothetical protein ACOY4K_00800 [Pseudomonadota bacterium]